MHRFYSYPDTKVAAPKDHGKDFVRLNLLLISIIYVTVFSCTFHLRYGIHHQSFHIVSVTFLALVYLVSHAYLV